MPAHTLRARRRLLYRPGICHAAPPPPPIPNVQPGLRIWGKTTNSIHGAPDATFAAVTNHDPATYDYTATVVAGPHVIAITIHRDGGGDSGTIAAVIQSGPDSPFEYFAGTNPFVFAGSPPAFSTTLVPSLPLEIQLQAELTV